MMDFSVKNLFIILLLTFPATWLLSQNRDTLQKKSIETVTLTAGIKKYRNKKENPAYAIMQEVWKRKRSNALQKYDTWQYREYEKIQFDLANLDSTVSQKKMFNKLEFIFKYADSTGDGKISLPLFLNESVYGHFGRNRPDKKEKRLLTAQKSSGFEDNEIISATAKNLYREIDLYQNTINYFDIGFQSPAASNGFGVYDYELMDTISLGGQEAFRIRYAPKNKEALALQGFLYISPEHFALLKANLRSTNKMNVNFVNNIFTEIEYDNPDAETFLAKKITTELDLSPFSKKKEAKSIKATRTAFFDQYQFNKEIRDEVFEQSEEELTKSFTTRDEKFWAAARADSLSEQEKGIYEMATQLEATPKFTRLKKLYETVDSGYYNVGKAIDLGNIYSVYGYNEVEGSRIRLGARTYFTQNDDWRIQGYLAYGFRDDKVKYGAEAKYMFNKMSRFTVGAGTRRDVLQVGVQLTNDDGIMSRSFASSSVFGRGENASLSHVNQTNVFASADPWKNITLRLDGTMQSIRSADENLFNLYYYRQNQLRKTVNDSHVTFSVIARPGAVFSQTGVDRYQHPNLAPTMILKYTRGIENLFNADFGYNKLQFLLSKPFLVGSWGKSFVTLEAGKNFNTVPLALQNVLPGNQSYSLVQGTFAQLNYYEFVADAYATGHWEHHFNGKILAQIPLINKLKFREVAFLRGAYGTLSEASKNINAEGFKYAAPDKNIYYEYGFGIENIGLGNLRIFRIDFNWRGNYLNRPDVSRFGIKFGFQFYY